MSASCGLKIFKGGRFITGSELTGRLFARSFLCATGHAMPAPSVVAEIPELRFLVLKVRVRDRNMRQFMHLVQTAWLTTIRLSSKPIIFATKWGWILSPWGRPSPVPWGFSNGDI